MEEKKKPVANPNQKIVIKTKEFVGIVLEVHSGDTLTI